MAIDPTQLAEEQTQRAALDAQGAPSEFARDPALSTQLAGGGTKAMLEVLNRLRPSPTETVDAVPGRVPTEQERNLIPDDGTYSERETKKTLAPTVLSPEGVEQFEQQNFQAKPDPTGEILLDAQTAINEEAQTVQSAVDVTEQAQKSLLADVRGFKPETAVVDEEKADRLLEMQQTREAGIKTLTDGGDFNFNNMNTNEDIEVTLTALSEIYKDQTVAATRGYIPNTVTVTEAAEAIADEMAFTKTLLKRKTGEGLNAETLVAARELLVRSAEKLNVLATKITTGQGSDLDRLAFRRQMSIHAGIQLQLKGAQTEAARALQSFQIKVGGEDSAVRQAQEARRMLMESGGVDLTDTMAAQFMDSFEKNGMKGANSYARGGWRSKTRQMLSEAYLAGLLSNPATQVKNIVGTAAFMAYQLPAEMIAGMFGSVVRKGRTGLYMDISEDQVYANDALLRFKGWMDSYKDALRAGALAFRTEMPAGASKLDIEQYRSIAGDNDTNLSRAISEFGKRARIPFNLLLAGDEFFKTISQRGELYVQANSAYQAEIREGKSVEQAQDAAGMLLLDPKSVAEELDVKARYDTLQSDLGGFGKFTGMVQRFDIGGVPVGRMIMPFAVAPTNSALRTAEFIPLNPKGIADLSGRNGSRAQQMAFGRWAVGGATMAVIADYSMKGQVTGSFPSDQKIREQLPPGWQPYSFVFRGKDFPEDMPLYDAFGRPNGPLTYVSYAGYEPVGAVIGITADTVQRMHLTRDATMRGNLASAAITATLEYYKELPMLQSMSDMVNALEYGDPIRFLKSPAEAATIVGVPNPLSSLQRAGGRIVDPGLTRPRDDQEYYTEADILETNDDGTYVFALPDGTPDYRVVGLPKSDTATNVLDILKKLDAYQSKDSMFRSEADRNAPLYDTLGQQIGANDISLASQPGLAIFNNLSGIRIRRGEEVSDYQAELMRLAAMTGGWPLTNPDSKDGLQLSFGVASDWINLSKNEVMIRKPGLGEVTFKDMLKYTLTDTSNRYGRAYERASDKERKALVATINRDFLEAGWEKLLQDPQYANLAQVQYDIEILKKEGRR